jgi:hypothetical protein
MEQQYDEMVKATVALTRGCGPCRTRYTGLAKTHLQHLITAVTLKVVRLAAWWLGTP